MPGVQTTDVPLASTLEEVLGNTSGTTSRQTISDLAVQLAARPELATLTAALSARVDTLEGVAGDSRLVDDIATGLAATESGSHFLILSADALTIYENVDGSESVVDVIPLASVTDALAAADAALDARLTAQEAAGSGVLQALDEVAAASTGNLALTGDTSPIDGVTLTNGQSYLAKDQTVASENGIYVFNDAGAHTRRADADSAAGVALKSVFVAGGSIHGGQVWATYFAATDTLDTDDMVWKKQYDGTGLQDQIDAKADAHDAALTGDATAENLSVSGTLTVGGTAAGSAATADVDDFVSSTVVSDDLPDLSGYAMSIGEDVNGRAAILVKDDGGVEMPYTPNFAISETRPVALSGVAVAFSDADGNKTPFGITADGDLWHKGEEVDLAALSVGAAGVASALNSTTIIGCFGDSLTHGNTAGVTTPYPAALASLMPGREINNRGLSGMTSLQTATRMGAVPSLLTVADNTIPASGAVTVTTTENGNFSTKSDFGSVSVMGSLYGIPGTLNISYNSGDPNLPGTTTFTRALAGAETLIPEFVPFIPDTGEWENNVAVIWVGRNDVISYKNGDTEYDADFALTNIQAMIDFLAPLKARFVVLTVTDSSAEYSGATSPHGEGFDLLISINKEIARRWPRNYIDIRKILVNSYDSGEADDVTAFDRNQVPPSLQQDGLHLNDAGYAIVAQAVYDFITYKGW